MFVLLMMASRVAGITSTLATQLAIPSILGFVLVLVLAEHRKQCSAITLGVSISMISDQPFLSGLRPPIPTVLRSVPFRLTRNMERLLQPSFCTLFNSSIGTILLAMRYTLEPGGLLEPYICLLGAEIDGNNHARSQGCERKFSKKRGRSSTVC